MAYFKIILPV